ncbi:iron uptake system protein EfeO [Frigidibacter sp. MR17.24]|uniref:iron uptake system protein EfeO n=1 Tax=Frigidibacter sp. MR17.24 TaxID=3127345 RepID=UPI003012E149
MTRSTLPLTAALALAALAHAPAAQARDASLDLVGPITDYKIWVADELDQLVADTGAFTRAVKAGDLETARALYAPTRVHYEMVEPVAELFADLDGAIDAREDDFEAGPTDPGFTGFHRIEYGLWHEGSTDGLAPIADKLLADVTDLDQRIAGLTFPPETVVGGAATLMEEVAATKVSGEEDRYSHTDLWDFRGNVDGAQKIVALTRPLIEADEPAFLAKVDENFGTIDTILAKYREGEGFVSYDKLSNHDRVVVQAAVNTLAEDLSTLRGKLGVD